MAICVDELLTAISFTPLKEAQMVIEKLLRHLQHDSALTPSLGYIESPAGTEALVWPRNW